MNAVSGIFLAVSLLFGGGYAVEKISAAFKRLAMERIHRGLPSLSVFSSRLSCAKIGSDGDLHPLPGCKPPTVHRDRLKKKVTKNKKTNSSR